MTTGIASEGVANSNAGESKSEDSHLLVVSSCPGFPQNVLLRCGNQVCCGDMAGQGQWRRGRLLQANWPCVTHTSVPCCVVLTLCRALWVVQHLGKLCWISGGLLVLLGVILAVLTVELSADPDKWPGRSEALGRMFGAAQQPAGAADEAAGPSSSGVVDAERQPLLQTAAQPGGGHPEIVEG